MAGIKAQVVEAKKKKSHFSISSGQLKRYTGGGEGRDRQRQTHTERLRDERERRGVVVDKTSFLITST